MNYNEVAQYCIDYLEGSLCVFLGAGMSMNSGLPSWNDLVHPLRKSLEISDDIDLPLPRILQYAYGENKAEYSRFVHQFRKQIQKAKVLSTHHLITRLDVSRIWTTNYDDLMERAFQINGVPVEVITNDFQLSNAELLQKQVIKLHGSLSSITDSYDDIVLTEGQYENCELGRSAVYNLLRNDIANRSFLFLGVSFDDINMRRIWASVWNNKMAGKPSFLFTVPPKALEKMKLFKLWKNDLTRYGITVVELNDYSEIGEFLRLLCIKKHGKTIAGIATYKDDTYSAFCKEFGRQLAMRKYNYHSGGGRFVSPAIANGIWEKYDVKNNMEKVTFFYRENGGSTNTTKGKVIYAGETYTDVRNLLFSSEKLCVVLGESQDGRKGMEEEIAIARKKGCVLLGIPAVGKMGEKIYREEANSWKRRLEENGCGDIYEKINVTEEEFAAYMEDAEKMKEYVKNIMSIIDAFFSGK